MLYVVYWARISADPPASPCGSNDRLGALLARMAGAVYTDYVFPRPKATQLIVFISVLRARSRLASETGASEAGGSVSHSGIC